MAKSITISLPENDYAHPLYVPGVKRAFIQYDPKANTLYADYTENDSVLERVFNGEIYEWSIDYYQTRGRLQGLMNTIAEMIQADTSMHDIGIHFEQTQGLGDPIEYADRGYHNNAVISIDGAIEGCSTAYDWIMNDWSSWIGSQSQEEFFEGLLDDTDNKLREWFIDLDYVQEDNEGNRHVQTDGMHSETVVFLLDYWRDKVEEYRAEKATV